jgi:hypothetical protein
VPRAVARAGDLCCNRADHAFELRSFTIPAALALMFLAIELLVLKG